MEANNMAEMRYGITPNHRTDHELLELYADRIEAAARREREMADHIIEEAAQGYPPRLDNGEVGNSVAIREALEELVANIETRASVFDIFSVIDRKTFLDAKAALAKPPRNCERFGGDYKMLHTAWSNWTASPSGRNPNNTMKMTFSEWLLAPANEKGETDGSK